MRKLFIYAAFVSILFQVNTLFSQSLITHSFVQVGSLNIELDTDVLQDREENLLKVMHSDGVQEKSVWSMAYGFSVSQGHIALLEGVGYRDSKKCSDCTEETLFMLVLIEQVPTMIYFVYDSGDSCWKYAEKVVGDRFAYPSGSITSCDSSGLSVLLRSYQFDDIAINLPAPDQVFTSRQNPFDLQNRVTITESQGLLHFGGNPNQSLDSVSDSYTGVKGEVYWLSYEVPPSATFTIDLWQADTSSSNLAIEIFDGDAGSQISNVDGTDAITATYTNPSSSLTQDLRIKMTVDSKNNHWQAIGYEGLAPGSSCSNPLDLDSIYLGYYLDKGITSEAEFFSQQNNKLIVPGTGNTVVGCGTSNPSMKSHWLRARVEDYDSIAWSISDSSGGAGVELYTACGTAITNTCDADSATASSSWTNVTGGEIEILIQLNYLGEIDSDVDIQFMPGVQREVPFSLENGEYVIDNDHPFSFTSNGEPKSAAFTLLSPSKSSDPAPSNYGGSSPEVYWLSYDLPAGETLAIEAFQPKSTQTPYTGNAYLAVEFFDGESGPSLNKSASTFKLKHTYTNSGSSEMNIRIKLAVDTTNDSWQAVAYHGDTPGSSCNTPLRIEPRSFRNVTTPDGFVGNTTSNAFRSQVVPGFGAGAVSCATGSPRNHWYVVSVYPGEQLTVTADDNEGSAGVEFSSACGIPLSGICNSGLPTATTSWINNEKIIVDVLVETNHVGFTQDTFSLESIP